MNVTESPVLFSLCNVYRLLVSNFSQIAPITKRLQKNQLYPFNDLTSEELDAQMTLKEKLISPPVLSLPRHEGRFIIYIDACDKRVGCVLLQEPEEGPRS